MGRELDSKSIRRKMPGYPHAFTVAVTFPTKDTIAATKGPPIEGVAPVNMSSVTSTKMYAMTTMIMAATMS